MTATPGMSAAFLQKVTIAPASLLNAWLTQSALAQFEGRISVVQKDGSVTGSQASALVATAHFYPQLVQASRLPLAGIFERVCPRLAKQ